MFVHYVEDNDLDALLMTNLTRKESDLKIERCRSIEDLRLHLAHHDADCVLLDLMRPDALSVEDDIIAIRKLTNAPVVFITSSDGDHFRKRAIQAGAEALIEKAALSSDVLKQIFYNVMSRPVSGAVALSEPHADRADMQREPLGLGLPNVNLDRLNLPLRFMQQSIGHLKLAQKYEDRLVMEDLEDLTDDLRTFAQSDLTQSSRVALDIVLSGLKQQLAIYSGRRGVMLRMALEACCFDLVGPAELCGIGLNRIISGFLIGAKAGDSIFVRSEKSDEGAILHIQSTCGLLDEKEALFDSFGTGEPESLAAIASLQVGILMLGLSPQQVQISTEAGYNCLTLHL